MKKQEFKEGEFYAKEFWIFYDAYIYDPTTIIKESLRKQIALHPKITELTRPENGWNHILAWESLDSVVIQSENGQWRSKIMQGEIIIEQHNWDRDVYITRVPKEEMVSGGILGNSEAYGGTLKGLFLPLYDAKVIKEKISRYFDKAQIAAMQFLEGEKEFWDQRK